MIISVTKKFEFCYGHSLPEHKGKCKNIHGHNAILEVEVGKVKPEYISGIPKITHHTMNGMLIDFGEIKEIVEDHIINKLDHKYLNDVMETGFLPSTAENMCFWIWLKLRGIFGSSLLRVRIYETPDSYAEIKNENS